MTPADAPRPTPRAGCASESDVSASGVDQEGSTAGTEAPRDAKVCGVAHEDVPTLPCTLPRRHSGRHEAWGANVLLGWWPQTEREHYYRGWNDCMDWIEQVDTVTRDA